MQKSLSRLFPVLVAFISLAGCGEDAKDVAEEQPLENTEALCSGNIDNDQNGLIDCKDLGCSLFKHCQGTSPETPKLENTEALCSGEVDNDEDGMADCEDPDCAEFKYCLCHNDKDDDGDYETDCEDEDCDGYCDDADDPDWSCEGTFINASEIMTANDKTKAVENFQNLTNFIEGNYGELTYFKENGYNEGEDYHLILDGNYHIEAKTKYEHIPLKRVVCLKGKNQDDDKQPMLYFRNNAGFGINEDGGMVAENIQFEDDENLGKV